MGKNTGQESGTNSVVGDLRPKLQPSESRRIFSVDDDINEFQNDQDFTLNNNINSSINLLDRKESNLSVKQIRSETLSNPVSKLYHNNANFIDAINGRSNRILSAVSSSGGNNIDSDDIYDNNGVNSMHLPVDISRDDRVSTTSSIESFTLRERQDAINKTHPFGIRIWKPALYKKSRSVEKAADEDIHETKLKKPLPWYIHLINYSYTVSFGLILLFLCNILGLAILLCGLCSKSSRDYSKVLFSLSLYLFYPFGKIVYLVQDDRYLKEDNNEGISVQQFYTWITSYSRIFSSQNNTAGEVHATSTTGDTQSKRDSYHSLNEIEPINQISYGSIQQYISDQQNQNINTQSSKRVSSLTSTSQRTASNANNNNDVDTNNDTSRPDNANNDIDDDSNIIQVRYFGRGKWTIGRLFFYIFFYLFLQPIILLVSLILWLFVFTIPMSNILWKLMYHCRRHPLALEFKTIKKTIAQDHQTLIEGPYSKRNVLLCTFRFAGLHYYKFTVDGTNIIVMNLIFMVLFTIFDFFVIKRVWGVDAWYSNETSIFVFCLISIIPLAFYIGQAVASISAQTSMGLGAAINAFFSTVVEIFLYCVALKQKKGLLVEGSMIGSILGAVLLLPGLSMCGGALYRKTQRYNPASAGVSSALLIFSMIVMFIPTILYEIYGGYNVTCIDEDASLSLSIKNVMLAMTTERCYFSHPPLKFNKLYRSVIQPMSVTCAVVLFMAYVIGLWFTLRTHAKMIWQVPIAEAQREVTVGHITEGNNVTAAPVECQEHSGGHDAPNWSRSKSTCILLGSTLLYATIAEILVDCVDSILEEFPGLNPKFLGLTIFALVPNTTEFLNAISFAMHGNVALSMEIGSAYALQVCLLQIPALVLYSLYSIINIDHKLIDIRNQMFPMVFPRWDLIGSMTSVFLFTYLYAEGKSNYFKGSMLILLYVVVIIGFYFQGVIRSEDLIKG